MTPAYPVEIAFLICSYIGTDGLLKEFCLGDNTLESCLDLLAHFLGDDLQLRRVQLMQHGQDLELPVEAFDATPIGCQLEALKKQWEAILQ